MQRRVLIVDDDPAVRELIVAILQRRGVTADGAADGEQAIAKLDAAPRYDAVVLDVVMPRLDGHGVIAYMREHHAQVPVIVLSGAIDGEMMPLDPALVRVAIRKPFVIDDLDVVINTVIAHATRDGVVR